MSLNLAQRPFLNSRPVRRLALALWCLGLLLLAANVVLYSRHFSGREERRDRLGELRQQEREERQRLAELEAELAATDLEWQNTQVDFLNLRIAERVFPWSTLFDQLAEVLPREVRLTRLRPRIGQREGRGRAAGPAETVLLELRGEARSGEAILDLIGRLFEDPAFREPNLASETQRARDKLIDFDLTVTYLPAVAAPAPAAPAPAAGEGEAG